MIVDLPRSEILALMTAADDQEAELLLTQKMQGRGYAGGYIDRNIERIRRSRNRLEDAYGVPRSTRWNTHLNVLDILDRKERLHAR